MLDLPALRAFVEDGPAPLFAAVSGAHLYGFDSPDSDVDLRGVFVLPLREVLGLGQPEETRTVEEVRGGLELDLVTHDVRKFAGLMLNRNGYVLEQLFSPLVVLGGPWHDELKAIGAGCVVRHLRHHYRGFARNQRRLVTGGEPTVKRLLYCYRVYLTGIHALMSGRIESNLPALLGEYPQEGLTDLVARKRAGGEKDRLESGEADRHRAALDRLEAGLDEAFDASALPDGPSDQTRAALSDLVVRARLELGG